MQGNYFVKAAYPNLQASNGGLIFNGRRSVDDLRNMSEGPDESGIVEISKSGSPNKKKK